jgi:uncharacterized protein (TIGR00725 family)
MRRTIIGVMGPGETATAKDLENAYELGCRIATEGWVLLTGGRKSGVMEAASQGAKANGGLIVGILPDNDTWNISEAVDIAIITDLGNGRNNVNVLSVDAVIACGMGLGTASEVALALKNGKSVVLLGQNQESQSFWQKLAYSRVFFSDSPESAIGIVKTMLTSRSY